MPTFVPLVSLPPDAPVQARWYLVRQGEVLVDEAGSIPALVSGPEAFGFSRGGDPSGDGAGTPPGASRIDERLGGAEPGAAGGGPCTEEPVLLGWLGQELCWAAGVAAECEAPEGFHWAPLRQLGGAWPIDEWALAGRAVQLVEWRRTSRYCGRCGTRTVDSPGERAFRCPACGFLAYPRLAPAIIVLVRRGDQALLAANRSFRGGMYSVLAGFVEAGESLEEAVHREVGEEVGVTLKNVQYFGSQPWPFPNSLMVGFTAEWESGEIEVDGAEILDASWWSVDDMPPIPPSLSIARRLIDHWVRDVTGKEPA